jgi:hypothetical protein
MTVEVVMDYGKLMARAFEITKNYRALWLFGFLLALFGGSSGGSFNFPSSGGGGNGDPFSTMPTLPPDFWQNITIIIVAVICIVLILSILGLVLRFLSRAALMGLVAELESAGTTPTVRRGFSIGADRFWSQLGIAIVINLPLTLIALVLILIAFAPMIAMFIQGVDLDNTSSSELWGVAGAAIVSSLVMICLVGLCMFTIYLIITPFYQFMLRACIIGRRGVMDSIREGYRLVRANLGNVAVLYLLVIGIGIGFGILMIPVALILIGVPVGGAIALGLATQSWQLPVVLGVCLGIPLILVLIFIGGLFQVFESTLWTEGYLATTAPKQIAQSTLPIT